MRPLRFSLTLMIALALGWSASAWTAPEVDPRVGFELETRGPIGQVLALFHQYWTLPAVLGSYVLLGQHPVTDALQWSAALGVPNVLQGVGRVVVLSFWQGFYFKVRSRPYVFDGYKLIDERTGFFVQMTADMFVTETLTMPATVETLRANAAFVDESTFGAFATLGGAAAWFMGSTHVHVGLDAFADDPQLLRDFVADLINTPALYWGPLTRDRFSSTDPRRHLAQVRAVIDQFDAGELRDTTKLAYAFRHAGLRKTRVFGAAIAIRPGLWTIELRFPRSVRNGAEMVLWAQLLKARLNHLRRNPGVVLVNRAPALNRDETYGQLRAYVTESGLEWAPYENMLPRRWRWFVGRRVKRCEAALAARGGAGDRT